MHVPLIANWPKTIQAGKVCEDLVDSTDFLPTMAAAAGAAIPEKLDGRSFLPQLKGEKGEPREWIYCWYAKDGGAEAEHESAFDARHKLTRGGQLFDLEADPAEKTPLPPDAAPDARKRLQAALDRFTDARPARLRKGK